MRQLTLTGSTWEADLHSEHAYLRNAIHDLELHRSYIHEVLTGPADQYVKDNLLEAVANIEANLRKVLL